MTETTITWGPLAHPIRSEPVAADAPPWKDNSYLAFWDPERAINGVVHCSTSPNAAGRRARASLQIGGATAEIAEDLDAGTFTSASIDLDLDGRVTVRTPEFTIEVEMAPRGAAADYSKGAAIPELVPGEPLQHFQQGAIVSGRVSLGDVESEVDAVGLRDRTWGYRDESQMWPEYIGLIADVDGELLSIMKFMGTDGSSKAEGWLLGEEARKATTFTDIARDAAGLFVGATIGFEDGETLSLRIARRTGGFWVPMGWERIGPTMSAYDEFLELRAPDGRGGYGFVEQGIVRRLT
jgi:hypothetical protein